MEFWRRESMIWKWLEIFRDFRRGNLNFEDRMGLVFGFLIDLLFIVN